MISATIDHQARPSSDRDDVLAGLPDAVAIDLADQIGRCGYGELRNLFSDVQLAQAREQAEAAVAAAGGGYAGLGEEAELHGAVLRDLRDSVTLAAICRGLFVRLYGGTSPPATFKQTLRCLSGTAGTRHNLYFHFDSYALTIIVPVAIPPAGPSGDLLLWPDIRSVRRSYLMNAVDKFLAERRLVQRLLGRLAQRARPLVRLRLVPGNLYVFSGYRTLHANEPVDNDALRATLVLHVIEFHGNAASKRLFGWMRRILAGRSA